MSGGNGNEFLPLDRASLFFERARQLSLFSSGTSLELERLLREVYKALSYDNTEIKYYLLLGKIYKQNLDITSAMFCYRFILRQNSSMLAARKFLIELLVLKGKEYMIMGIEMKWKAKFTAARSCFDEALEYNRENFDLWILKSVCHVHCGELVEAYEAVSKVIKPNRELSAEVYILRAKINWGRGLTEAGNQDIRFAASINPDHPEVLGFIARSYAKSELLYQEALHAFALEKFKEALELVDHALHITTEDIKLYILKARIYRMLGELQSAYEAIMKSKSIFEEKYEIEEYPISLPPEILLQTNLILNEMAIKYASEGNYHDAILLYNKILRSEENLNATLIDPISSNSPGEGLSPSSLSPAAKTMSPTKAAAAAGSITTKSRGPARHQINYKYYMNRGDCYRALNQYHDASLDYQTAFDLAPNDWTIRTKLSLTHYLIGTEYFNASRFYEADIELSKAITYNPKVSEYFALRGKAKYYLNDLVGAHSDYRKVIELDPANTEIKLRLQQFEDHDKDPPSKGKSSSSATSSAMINRKETLEIMIQNTLLQKKQPRSTTTAANNALATNSPSNSIPQDEEQNLLQKALPKKIDPKLYSKELLLKAKEREAKLEEVLQQSRYKTDPKVLQITPETRDYLAMMLLSSQERLALPALKLKTNELKEEQEILRQSRHHLQLLNAGDASHLSQSDQFIAFPHPRSAKSQDEILLPKILQKSRFLPAHLAKAEVTQKQELIHQNFQDRSGTERGDLWKIVDTAKEIALSKTSDKLKATAEKTKQRRLDKLEEKKKMKKQKQLPQEKEKKR